MFNPLNRDKGGGRFTRLRRTLTIGFFAVVLVSLVTGQQQRDAWRLASLEQSWLEGHTTEVIGGLADLARRSGNPQKMLEVAQRALNIEQLDLAIQLSQEGRTRFGGARDASGQVDWSFTQIEAFALHQAGRNAESVELCRDLADDPRLADQSDFLNGFAYVRALAGIDLDSALADIVRASERLPSEDYDFFHRLALLAWDARKIEDALVWIEKAITDFSPIYRQRQQEFSDRIALLLATASPDDETTQSEITDERESIDQLERRWSSLHAHRAQLLIALGRSEEAQQDQAIVEQAGGDLERETRLRFRIDELMTQSAYLDTRGWILYRQGNAEAAIKSLDIAVELARWIDSAEGHRMDAEQKRVVRSEDIQAARKESRRGLATLRYHRSVVLRELGRLSEADQEEQEVVAMGFEIGPHLH